MVDEDTDWVEEDVDALESIQLEYEILNYPADTTLAGYQEQFSEGKLEVPTFQRNFVWDVAKASRLIESFLIGLPVPGVFLYKKRDGSSFQVIDGHQRITSVVSYLNGLIGEKKFRLKNVASAWDGMAFVDLTEKDQFKLRQSVMRSTIIQQLDPLDDTSIFMIFERLNTGGVNLNPMEVRRCVYHGDFIEFLDRLNRVPSWRKCLAKPDADKRYRDVELVLKVLAMFENGKNYKKPYKGFLNNYLTSNRNRDEVERLERKFTAACDAVVEVMDERPFHLRGRLNQAAADSILSVLMRKQTSPSREAFDQLLADGDFQTGTTRNTSDELEVGLRLGAADRHLV